MHLTTETSLDAFAKAKPKMSARMETVLSILGINGQYGATRKDLEEYTGYVTPTMCSLLNRLEKLNKIAKRRIADGVLTPDGTLTRRRDCAVYVLSQYMQTESPYSSN